MAFKNRTVAVAEPDADFRPSNNQKALLAVAMKCGMNRNIRAMCREANISHVSFYSWLKIPGFAALWRDLPVKVIQTYLPNASAALMAKAIGGDVAAIKLAMQAAKIVGSGAVEVHVGDKIGQQLNVTHLDLIPRADNHEQFLAIKRAMEQAMADAEEAAAAKTEVIDVPR